MTEIDAPTRGRASAREAVRWLVRSISPASDEGELTARDHERLVWICYLWPVTVVGFFLPVLVFARFRNSDELGLHARHGALLSSLYGGFLFVLGIIHGVAGRLVEDWTNVTLICGLVLVVVSGVLASFGARWYGQALRDEPIHLPIISSWAERL